LSDVPEINKRYKGNTKFAFLHWKLDLFPAFGNKVGPVRLEHCVIGLVYLPTLLLKDGSGFVL
jgi:hypothetical protein